MQSSTPDKGPVLNVQDKAGMFHIVLPQRSTLAGSFDRDISAKQAQGNLTHIPFCFSA